MGIFASAASQVPTLSSDQIGILKNVNYNVDQIAVELQKLQNTDFCDNFFKGAELSHAQCQTQTTFLVSNVLCRVWHGCSSFPGCDCSTLVTAILENGMPYFEQGNTDGSPGLSNSECRTFYTKTCCDSGKELNCKGDEVCHRRRV